MWQYLVNCLKLEGDKSRKHQEQLGMEKFIRFNLPSGECVSLSTTPSLEQELVLGYLIAKLGIRPQGVEVNHVENHVDNHVNNHDNHDVFEVRYIEENHEDNLPENSTQNEALEDHEHLRFNRNKVYKLTASFQEKSLLYKDISISHSAALADANQIHYFAEDLSRFNAWHKVVGLWGADHDKRCPPILIVSGKLDAMLMQQAISLGVNTVISRLAPTDRALRLAVDADVALIGFARGTRMTVYAGVVH